MGIILECNSERIVFFWVGFGDLLSHWTHVYNYVVSPIINLPFGDGFLFGL